MLDTLVSRPAFARALLDAIGGGQGPTCRVDRVPRAPDPQPGPPGPGPEARRSLGRAPRLGSGEAGLDGPAQAAAQPRGPGRGRPGPGARRVQQALPSCHMLYGRGSQVGPDLTGAGRDNLDYVLENIIDPSATVTADFRMVVVAMQDGRVLNGIVKSRNDTHPDPPDAERAACPGSRRDRGPEADNGLAHARRAARGARRGRGPRPVRLPDGSRSGPASGGVCAAVAGPL